VTDHRLIFPLPGDAIDKLEEHVAGGGHVDDWHTGACLIATLRDAEKRIDLARDAAREEVASLRLELDGAIDRMLATEAKAADLKRERNDAASLVPRLRDEIRSLHAELERTRR
jgi:hypothetical protein